MSTKSDLLKQMFSDCETAAERVDRFEQYQKALQESIDAHDGGSHYLATIKDSNGAGQVLRKRYGGAQNMDALMERMSELAKGSDPQVQADFAQFVDIAKDWTVTLPGGGSSNPAAEPVPYDLQHPLKWLVPLHTLLVNEIPTEGQGEGTATHWKTLDSLQGSGVGTLGQIDPFFSSQTDTNSFGSLSLRRGAKINYTTSDHTAKYVEWGLSDLVADVAQYSGAGFANVRQLSQHALAWTHLMAKERAMLFGRGSTGGGYVGSVGTPAGVSAVGASTGGSIGAGTYSVIVTFVGHFGEAASAEATTAALTGSTNKITVSWTAPAASKGVAYANVYVGTSSGTEVFQTKVVGNNSVVLTTYSSTGAATPAASSDTSFSAKAFDGLIPNIAANGGFVKAYTDGTKWASDSTVGNELQAAFLSMWQLNFATPSQILMDVGVKVGLGKAIQANGNATPYRIAFSQTDGKLGTAVTGIQNLSSPNDDMVDFVVHPFMPSGTVILRSPTLPFPAEGITATSAMRMVQGLVTIDWPRIQHTYDSSTYEYGTFVHYAPQWSGIFQGVTI